MARCLEGELGVKTLILQTSEGFILFNEFLLIKIDFVGEGLFQCMLMHLSL